MSAALIAILALWLMLTIVAQFPHFKWIRWLQDRDYFALIPNWSFFAPNPGASDFQILYRDKLLDEQPGLWQDIALYDDAHLHAIWNPDKRRRKALTNACLLLLQIAASQPKSELCRSAPYLLILSYIKLMPHNSVSDFRQFLIAHTFGYSTTQKAEILFISQFHKLEVLPCQGSLP